MNRSRLILITLLTVVILIGAALLITPRANAPIPLVSPLSTLSSLSPLTTLTIVSQQYMPLLQCDGCATVTPTPTPTETPTATATRRPPP